MAEQNTPKLHGTIVRIQGDAWLKLPDGKVVQLRPGDRVEEGQTLVTGPGGQLEMDLPEGRRLVLGPDRSVLADQEMLTQATVDKTDAALLPPDADTQRVIAALAAGTDPFDALDPTAAGLAANGADNGHSFVRVLRIVEDVTPLSFSASNAAAEDRTLPLGTAEDTDPLPMSAENDAVSTNENQTVVISVLDNDRGGRGSLTVTAINNIPVTAGSTISLPEGRVTLNNDGTLSFTPTPDYNGPVNINYTVSDGRNSSSANVNITVVAVNELPVSANQSVVTLEDQPVSGVVTATDRDGDPLRFSKNSDPAHGSVVVNPDGSWTYTRRPTTTAGRLHRTRLRWQGRHHHGHHQYRCYPSE